MIKFIPIVSYNYCRKSSNPSDDNSAAKVKLTKAEARKQQGEKKRTGEVAKLNSDLKKPTVQMLNN